MPMHVGTVVQAKGVDSLEPHAPQCNATVVLWRARTLRAQRFQKPGMPLESSPACKRRSRLKPTRTGGYCSKDVRGTQPFVDGLCPPGMWPLLWSCSSCTLPCRLRAALLQRSPADPSYIPPPPKAHNIILHPHRKSSPSQTSVLSHSGPKSGGSSLNKTVLGLILLPTTAGVRVSSTAVVEEGPSSRSYHELGKRHGIAPGSGLPLGSQFTHAAKRAYRRARNRAAASLEGGTFYKGQWHTRESLQALAAPGKTPLHKRPKLQKTQQQSRHPVIRSFSWNTGGLCAPTFQELVAWLDLENRFEVVILQETHWRESTDFRSGRWFCVHSSGYGSDLSYDRYGGVLVMLHRDAFEEPSVQELYPGRLVHVRAVHKSSYLTVDIFGIYQHVYRTQLSAEQNHSHRQHIWDTLAHTLHKLPTRNPLLIGGDFNSQLAAQRPHVGATCRVHHEGPDRDKHLHKLLADNDLCVLNSWHSKPGHTYESAQSKTRIDFVITRLSEANGRAKHAAPNYTFPVKSWTTAGHWPIEAHVQVVPFSRRARSVAPAQVVKYDKAALQMAIHAQSEQAQALKQTVCAALQELQVTELHQVRDSINSILLAAVEQHFPAHQSDDQRISAQGEFRASAKRTWQLYRELKVHHVATTHSVFCQWKAATAFMRASRALRVQSRRLKQASLLHKLAEAEAAATKGDQKTLHQIVRSLTPKKHQFLSRLRDEQGRLLDKADSLQAMLRYAKDTFSIHADEVGGMHMHEGLLVSDQDVQQELQKLGLTKAVPFTTAPAAVWKHCAGDLAALLGPAVRMHFQAGSQCKLRADLHDAYITLIPKPNKPGTEVANLRSIGLQCPSAKMIAGLLRQTLLDTLLPLVQDLPQYAYTKSRGTFDAILRVHMHFEEVSQCLRANRVNRFQQHQGKKPSGCVGGLCMSLDLSKAYDLASRPIIYSTLAEHGVPQDTISVIKQLHCDAQYIFRSGPNVGRQTTTNGLKQGCCIAPFLWSFYTIAVMHTLRDRLGPDWLQHALVLFADDHWCQWTIRSKDDMDRSVQQLTVVLETLMDFKMSINFKKTAILLRLEGKQAKAVMREHIKLKNGDQYFCVQVKGQEQLIPIKTVHEHLGTKVTYSHRLDSNLGHRLKSGQAKYQALRKTLNGHHALHVRYRLRLWAACVQTSFHYSLAAVGLTSSGLGKLTTASTRHLRAIQRLPAHLTRTTNQQVWQQADMQMPGQATLQVLERFTAALQRKAMIAPDITTRADVRQHLSKLEARLRALVAQQSQQDAQLPMLAADVPCPFCDAVFHTENAMRIHSQLVHHDLPPRAASTPTQFVPKLHACGGLPQCRLCLRTFYRWQNLKEHIESGACDKLGGESLSKHPIRDDAQASELQSPPAPAESPDTATGTQQNVPLLERGWFTAQLHNWESLLREPTLQSDLQSHCTICHMWVASFRHVKQHIHRVHEPETPGLHAKALALCLSFKQHLVRDHQCPWCKRKVWAPARHSQQCVVLYQLSVARIRHQIAQDGGPDPGAQRGGRHLQVLQPHTPQRQTCTTESGSRTRRTGGGDGGVFTASQTSKGGTQSALFFPARDGPGLTSTPEATQESHPLTRGQTHGEIDATARGPVSGAAHGQGLCSIHAPGPCHSHPEPPCNFDGVACQEGRRPRGPHLILENTPSSLSDQRTACSDSEAVLHAGGTNEASSCELVGCRLGMDFPQVVSQNQEAQGGPQSSQPLPHRADPSVDISAREPPRRHHSQVPQHQRLGSAGGKCLQPTIRDLFAGRVSARGASNRDSRSVVQAAGKLGMAAGGSLDEKREPPTRPSGQRACQAAVQQVSPLDDEHAPVQPGADGNNILPSLTNPSSVPHHIPTFSLSNPGNHCYAIAFLYSLDIVLHRTQHQALMPHALRKLQGCQHAGAFQHLGFLLLGWQEPERQHDVSEFIDFMHFKLMPRSVQGTWHGRRCVDDGSIQRTVDTPTSQCLILGAIPRHRPELQTLINHWFAQDYRQALARSVPWLFLQLPRFRQQATGIIKARQCYTLGHSVQMPIFRDQHSMEVSWHSYDIVAFICHRGVAPSSGHYYVAAKGRGGFLALDDDKKPASIDSQGLQKVSREMYVVVLAKTSVEAHSASSTQPAESPPALFPPEISSDGQAVATVHGSTWRRVDCEPDLSSGSAHPSTGPGYGHPATATQCTAAPNFCHPEEHKTASPAPCTEELTQQVQNHATAD